MNLYKDRILDHYRKPRNFGRIVKPDASYEQENSFCGDRIGMEIKLLTHNPKLITLGEIKFWGEGCAISQASASMLTEKVKGKSLGEIKKLGKEDILSMLGIELSPARLKCALLPLEVLQKLITLL
ncbi:MAG: iron-sulfur cluster assembly scaffold protein [Patescibacteria group bacterium]|nr:iron-sulfur cluster assembly scaffold protein [Patescibacteria group bacterium]MCL5095869.1 iron-sulfur cluster assembly scaffold protein [Patescibacteria group bacterium]